MLLAPIYARIMTMLEYGFNSTISTWSTMLSTIVTGNLTASIERAKYEFPGQLRQFNSSILFLGTLITAAFYGIVMLFPDFFCELIGCRMEYLHLWFGCWLVAPALGILQAENRLENKYKSVVVLTLSTWVISSAVSLLMLVSEPARAVLMGAESGDRIYSMSVASNIPSFLLNIILYILIMARGRTMVNLKFWRFALAMCLPLIPHLLAGKILTGSDRIMVTKICGEEFTALYSMTYTCSAVISMVFNSLNSAWTPWFNDRYFHEEDGTVYRITTVYYILFFLITLGGIGLGPELLAIIGGEKYMSAVNMMPVVMVSCFFQFTNAFFVNVEMCEKKTYFTATGTSLAAVLNVALNLLLLPVMGYQVAAWTTLAGFVFLFIYHYSINRKLIGKRVKILYPMKAILCCLLFQLALIAPAIWLYSYTWPRYLIIGVAVAVFFAVVFLKKNNIKNYMFGK